MSGVICPAATTGIRAAFYYDLLLGAAQVELQILLGCFSLRLLLGIIRCCVRIFIGLFTGGVRIVDLQAGDIEEADRRENILISI